VDTYNLISFCGIFILCGVAWLLSADRRRMNWRLIGWGIGLQLLFGLFVFVVPAGAKLFLLINVMVVKTLDAATAGTKFVFGALALPPGAPGSLGFFLAFQALPTIIFFSALMSLLYYVNLLPLLIRFFARIFTRFMKVSGAESLCTASNIFVGVESAFIIRPHLAEMTRSELCTVLTAGLQCHGAICLLPAAALSDHRRPPCFRLNPLGAGSSGDVENSGAGKRAV
jgi:CNT family concentrative nucleoside transporter